MSGTTDETRICPRSYWEGMPAKALWRQHPAMGGSTHPDFLACSWCGSMDPDVLMAGLREGRYLLGGSDKAYKWYVESINPRETVGKFYTPHLHRVAAQELLALWDEHKLAHSMYVRPWLPSLADDAPDVYVLKMGERP